MTTPAEGTSGLVTVVFTDLVGSTALAQQLGDAAADDLRRTHFDCLREAVAETGGTEVKTIGDALMVTYTGAADAIAGAVAMQRGVDRQNREGSAAPIAMRVGMSAGDASFENGDWFGAPVVEASRLCNAAEGGQVLLTDIVRVLAGSRCDHELVPVGEIEAKGLPAPLVACEAKWTPEDPDAGARSLTVPLPAVVGQADRFSFVGRDAPRAELVDAWKEAVAGECRAVLVAGEPGIGKTRLVREACRIAHDQGGVVLWGGCEDELGIPFQPFAEALRGFVSHVGPDDLADLIGPIGGELVRLVPDLAALVPDLGDRLAADPDGERYRLFEAVADLMIAIAERAPLVLVLDDLHWAGKPSLLLLRHILRGAEQHRVLVIVTYRDTDLDRTHPLAEMLADLRRQPGVARMPLTGLDLDGVADFMEHTAGHDLEEPARELAAAVHAETEGNPFFVGEVLLHLAESGALVFRDGRWTRDSTLEEVGIPEGVREVVGRRLSHLDRSTNEALTVAAVIGRQFDVATLGAVIDGGREAAFDAIEAAEESGLVEEGTTPGTYRFAHALVRTTLYDELGTARRLRLHRDVALALAARPDADRRASELARHFAEAAALGHVDEAVAWGTSAGEEALVELAWEEATAHYQRALDALGLADHPDPGRRAALLLGMGRSLRAMGDPDYEAPLTEVVELARSTGDGELLADAALELCGNRFGRGGGLIDQVRVDLLEEALEIVAEEDLGRRALLLAALTAEIIWGGDIVRRRSLSDTALELARASGEPDVLGTVLLGRVAAWDPTVDTVGDHLPDVQEVVRLAREIGDRVLLCTGLLNLSTPFMVQGQREEGEALLREAETLADQLRQPRLEQRSVTLRTAALLLSGRLSEAEDLVGVASAQAQRHGLQDPGPAVAYRLHYERGTLGELEPLFAAMAEEQPTMTIMRTALLGIYSTTDRFDEAAVHLRALAADDWAMVRIDNVSPVVFAGAARVAGLAGELEIAASAAERARPQLGTLAFTGQTFEQPVALSVGTASMALGDYEDAEALFTQSVALCQSADAPTFEAATEAQWAEMCLLRNDSGDDAKALDLATRAIETAQRLKLGRIEVLSQRVLDRL